MHRDPHRYFRLGMLRDSNLPRMRGGSGATQPAQVCGPARLGRCCPISDATHFPADCFSAAMYLSWCLLLPETFVRRAFETNISVTGSPPYQPSQPRRVRPAASTPSHGMPRQMRPDTRLRGTSKPPRRPRTRLPANRLSGANRSGRRMGADGTQPSAKAVEPP